MFVFLVLIRKFQSVSLLRILAKFWNIRTGVQPEHFDATLSEFAKYSL
jgi:hypothetical protein